ncbi:hypothetical protein RhiJN_16057 [Ceratobasidium sp. AG-Ba]|nr:hypothetical protein RhiJN_16057 [Ceratobasidium sp. AG-Ba]
MLTLPFCTSCGIEVEFWRMANSDLLVRLCHDCRTNRIVRWADIDNQSVKALVASTIHFSNAQERQDGIEYSYGPHVEKGLELWSRMQSGDVMDCQRWEEWKKAQQSREELSASVGKFLVQERLCIGREWKAAFAMRAKGTAYDIDPEQLLPESRRAYSFVFCQIDIMNKTKWAWVTGRLDLMFFKEARMRRRIEREGQITALRGLLESEAINLANGLSSAPLVEAVRSLAMWAPVPSFIEICELSVIKDWLNADIPSHEVEPSFAERRSDFVQAIKDEGIKMRKAFVRELTEARTEFGLPEYPPQLQTSNASPGIDLYAEFDEDTNILARADTIFCVATGFTVQIFTYDTLIKGFYGETDGGLEFKSFAGIKLHHGASSKAQEILSSAGYQNVSCVELNRLSFECGRCSFPNISGIVPAIIHYVELESLHNRIILRRVELEAQDRQYEYGHDLEGSTTPALVQAPAVPSLTSEESTAHPIVRLQMLRWHLSCEHKIQIGSSKDCGAANMSESDE